VSQATARFKERIIPGPKPYYVTGESCSVWFEPAEVWELRGADLTISPVHKVWCFFGAGLGFGVQGEGF
jgi:DNA ligase 1